MRTLRWLVALTVAASYGFHVWANRPDTEATTRALALKQVEDSAAPVQALAHLQQAQTLGWLVVALVVLLLVSPEIVRFVKTASAELSAR